jgi:hypothetical protein
MSITGLLAEDPRCPHGHDCPKVHDTDGDDVIVQGARIDDATRAELAMPDHEDAVALPRRVIYPPTMSLAEMAAWIDARHTFHLLRVENRRAYAAASDGGDFARFLAGEAEPKEGAAWQDRLRASTQAGKLWTKLHVIEDDRPSPYEQYEASWGFRYTTRAGEVVKILSVEPGTLADVPDFWVVDHEHVMRMTYDDAGRFAHAQPVTGPDAATYRALARLMWSQGQLFEAWWEAHPDLHRDAA